MYLRAQEKAFFLNGGYFSDNEELMNRETENPRLFASVCWFLNFVSSSRKRRELV
jgi:hypothetical protein